MCIIRMYFMVPFDFSRGSRFFDHEISRGRFVRPGPIAGPGRLRVDILSLLAAFVCLKHPSDPEFVVQTSVNAKERLFQGVEDFGSIGELFEKSLQFHGRSPAQVETNRIAGDSSPGEEYPVCRR